MFIDLWVDLPMIGKSYIMIQDTSHTLVFIVLRCSKYQQKKPPCLADLEFRPDSQF